MSEFEKTIRLAKQQLPGAFTVAGSLPYSDGGAPRAIAAELEETFVPTGAEDTKDFEDAFRELGFETIAFYVSFHRPTAQGPSAPQTASRKLWQTVHVWNFGLSRWLMLQVCTLGLQGPGSGRF